MEESVPIKNTNKKNKATYDKLYRNILINLNKLRTWRTEKKSKYYKNIENFQVDFNKLIDNNICTLKDIQSLYNLLYKSRFITIMRLALEEEELKIINEEKKKKELEPILMDNIEDDMFDIIEINVYKKISNFLLNILDKIKNKFGVLNDNLIYAPFKGVGICKNISNDIIQYLKNNNFKIKTKKIFIDMLKNIDIDFIDIIDFTKINIDNETIEYILTSNFIKQNNFIILNKIFEICKLKDKNEFTEILINLLLDKKFYSCDNLYSKLENIFKWILEMTNTEYISQFLNMLPFLIYINMYYDGEHNFYDENFNYDNFMNNLTININQIFENYVDMIKNKKITYNIKTYDIIDTKIIKELYHIHTPILINKEDNTKKITRRQRNKLIENIFININCDKYYDFEDDKTYKYSCVSLTGLQIKKIFNILRLKFYNYIKNYLIKEKTIDNIAQNNIFKYYNFLLNNDEKIELFKYIFIGKITINNLKLFVENHNQIADFLIINHSPNEDIIKLAFKVSNYNFIKKIIELKYHIKTSYLNYIIENKYIKEILSEINKFNTLIFDDNEEWIKNIKYLNPNLDIAKCIYDDTNEDMQINLTKKIEEINKHDIILLDKLDIKDFKEYISKYKLKFKLNEIIRFTDYIKRAYLLDYIY